MLETMSDEIDYKVLYDVVQGENERLRLRIVKLRNASSLFDKIDMGQIKTFIEENYIVILVACMVLTFARPIVTSLIRLIRSKGDQTHEG
jgi:hypothetical protein